MGADTLTGGKSVDGSESVYKDDKNYTYTLSDSVLIISQGNFSFQVRDFSNGENIIKVCEFEEWLKRSA